MLLPRSNLSLVPRGFRFYSKIINLDKKADEIKKAPLITDKFSTLREKYEVPHYPIVLCHGFSGFDKLSFLHTPSYLMPAKAQAVGSAISSGLIQFDYWRGIREPLEQLGTTVMTAKVPPFGTIAERAAILDKFIKSQCKQLRKSESKATMYNSNSSKGNTDGGATFKEEHSAIKLNLISHSMGGLDCRYLISNLQESSRKYYEVVSLTTISTPHHGSECADFLVEVMGNSKVLRKLCPASVFELTTRSMEKFNKTVPNDPKVEYFSYGARFEPRWFNLFNLTWRIMRREQSKKLKVSPRGFKIDSDGMVSVESAKWGHYIGTLNEVDHLDLINWTNTARKVLDKLVFREEPKFNALALYMDIADHLAKKGF